MITIIVPTILGYGIILLETFWNLPSLDKIMLPDLQKNDIVRMRKPHPCGGYEWKVTRLGADIGLECRTCGHRVMLTRRELVRRAKTISIHDTDGSTVSGENHANTK